MLTGFTFDSPDRPQKPSSANPTCPHCRKPKRLETMKDGTTILCDVYPWTLIRDGEIIKGYLPHLCKEMTDNANQRTNQASM